MTIKTMTSIPLHNLFERMFNISKITTEEQMDALIKVLGDDIKKNGDRVIIPARVKFIDNKDKKQV